jgi:hypothetical protein
VHLEAYRWDAAEEGTFLEEPEPAGVGEIVDVPGHSAKAAQEDLFAHGEGAAELDPLENLSTFHSRSPQAVVGDSGDVSSGSTSGSGSSVVSSSHRGRGAGGLPYGSSVLCCEERMGEGEVLAMLSGAARAGWVPPRQVNFFDEAQKAKLEQALLPFLNERLQARPSLDANDALVSATTRPGTDARGLPPVAAKAAPHRPTQARRRRFAVVFVRTVFRAAALLPWGPPAQRRVTPCVVDVAVLPGGRCRVTCLPLGRRFGRPPPIVLAWPALAAAAEPHLRSAAGCFPAFVPVCSGGGFHDSRFGSAAGRCLAACLGALCASRGGLRLANTATGGVQLVVAGASDARVRSLWGGEVAWPEDAARATCERTAAATVQRRIRGAAGRAEAHRARVARGARLAAVAAAAAADRVRD